jgi:HTH-type transcriptional regulator/antitoxin HigA
MSATAKKEKKTLNQVTPAWKAISALVHPIKNEDQYDEAQKYLDALLDMVGTDSRHPLYGLLETLGELMLVYEERHHKIPAVNGREMLRYFMELHELNQTDLKKELGGQGAVSEVLNGRRNLNVRQMRALGKRFGVSPTVFFDETGPASGDAED